MKNSLLFSSVLVLTLLSAFSFGGDNKRGTQIKFLGLYNNPVLKLDPTTGATVANKTGFGGGMMIEFPLGSKVGFEIGAVYTPYIYGLTSSGLDWTISWNMIHAPALFRFHFGNVFSLGLGGYYGMAMGKMKLKATALGQTVEAEDDLDSAAKSDYGVVGSMGFTFRLGKSMRFILEGRYLHGLKNLSASSSTTAYFSHMQGLAGFGFEF